MLFKDACNSKSNQKNLGTIKSSNLCTEIIEYTDPDEVGATSALEISSVVSRSLCLFISPSHKHESMSIFSLRCVGCPAFSSFSPLLLCHHSIVAPPCLVCVRQVQRVCDIHFPVLVGEKKSPCSFFAWCYMIFSRWLFATLRPSAYRPLSRVPRMVPPPSSTSSVSTRYAILTSTGWYCSRVIYSLESDESCGK